jgi:hypothetical protein
VLDHGLYQCLELEMPVLVSKCLLAHPAGRSPWKDCLILTMQAPDRSPQLEGRKRAAQRSSQSLHTASQTATCMRMVLLEILWVLNAGQFA